MPQDTLDQQVSAIIGRKVERLNAPSLTSSPIPRQRTTSTSDSIESIIGHPIQPISSSPMLDARLRTYGQARINGFDQTGAIDVAKSLGVASAGAKPEGIFERAKREFGKTQVGQNVQEFSRMFRRLEEHAKNPLGLSDEDTMRLRSGMDDFMKEAIPTAMAMNPYTAPLLRSKGATEFVTGTGIGAAGFAVDMTSPEQVALMLGTFGESTLVQGAARLGMPWAVPAARTLSKLMQLQFTAQMIEGAATGAENTWKAARSGDWTAAGENAVEGLSSALMAHGIVTHEQAQARVRNDLEITARDLYGVPTEDPIRRVFASKFNQLSPFEQGHVIDETVKRTPDYQAIVGNVEENDEKAKKFTKQQHEQRLHEYYGRALQESWNPNVANRTVRNLQRSRQRRAGMESEEARQQAIRDVVSTIRKAAENRASQVNADIESRRREGVEARPETRAAEAAQRTARTDAAQAIERRRNEVWEQRQELGREVSAEEVPRREVEAVTDAQGNVTYPAHYWGEDHSFGVLSDVRGHGVYRQTPRGVEWLDQGGNFSEVPENLYFAHDPETADTLARLSALSTGADFLAGQEGATKAATDDSDALAAIRRDLVEGTITAREAQRRAGIDEKIKLPDEFAAAQMGRLNGPFYEQTRAGFIGALDEEAQKAGLSPEATRDILENAGVLAQQQIESNLNHVFRPGDYIISKRGITWTLDSKGMLHPSDGGQPVPLMKNGFYSNTVMYLASSGRIGYGTKTRFERRQERARQREIDEDIRRNQEEVDREMRLAVQREGLETIPEEAPRADIGEKEERRVRMLSRPPQAPSATAVLAGKVGKLIYKAATGAETITGAPSIIGSIANRNGVSPEEVMRRALASDPERANTLEAQIARLEVGDEISDPFRQGRPWKVTERNGKLELRSGAANPIPLDRLNPSDRVRGIVGQGKVTSDIPEFDQEDVAMAAYNKPHYVTHEEELTQQVRDIVEGKEKEPEPKTPEQIKAQATSADRRANAAEAVATREVIDSLDPQTDSLREAEAKVQQANDAVKTAETAYTQSVDAKARTEPDNHFLRLAPASIGLVGRGGTIVQNGREVPFHYEVLPIDALVSSHVWRGTQMIVNPDYPSEMQPRTISEAESKQNALRAERKATDPNTGKTTGYNFAEYIDSTISGTMGPAIVDQGGRVVGGNTRIGIMRRHLQNLESIGDPEERAAAIAGFRSAMRKAAQDVGITYDEDGKFKVLVRMMDKPIETTREAAELGRLFNKSVSVQITKSAKGVSYSKSFDSGLLTQIALSVEKNDGLTPAMQADSEIFRNIVIDRFGVDPTEYADWFTDDPTKGLVLSEDGRRQFSKALLGTVIKDTSLLNRLEGTTPYRAVERALPYILKMKALGPWDISQKITEAMQASSETINTDPGLSKSRDKWRATYNPDQTQFLGMESTIPPEPDRVVESLWRGLTASDAASPRVFNDRLKSYLSEQESTGMIFAAEQETPGEAFNRAFGAELRQVAFSRGGPERITNEEFEQALKNRELSEQERADAVAPKKEPPIVEFRKQAAKIEEKLPAPDWGFTRLWRGNRPGDEGKATQFTTDLPGIALPFQKGYGGPLTYVDVPTEDLKRYNVGQSGAEYVVPDEIAKIAKVVEAKKGIEPPPRPTPPAKIAEQRLAAVKTERGFVTPEELQQFLESHPATKDHASELMRTARMMAEYVASDEGIPREDALKWVLAERLAKIESGTLKTQRGEYTDPNLEKGIGERIMRLHEAADPTTFIHEFAHVIFPLLSDEDIRAIDTIKGREGKRNQWDGKRKNLSGHVYASISEKLAHSMERFLRDEVPTGFPSGEEGSKVKAVLSKIKEILRNVYIRLRSDPLSLYKPTEAARSVFAKMFNITEFDIADTWQDEVRKARVEEARLKPPKEELHPLTKLAKQEKASGIRQSIAGKVQDTVGDHVDPRKPVAVLFFDKPVNAAAAWAKIGTEKSNIKNAELVIGQDGGFGIKFNTEDPVPPGVLYQGLPERHPGLELEDLEKRLKGTPSFKVMERKLLQLQIDNLRNRIRAEHGVEVREEKPTEEAAAKAIQEVKSGRKPDEVRAGTHGPVRLPEPERPRGIPKPPVVGKPHDAGAGGARSGDGGRSVAGGGPRTLKEVAPVNLEPLTRGRGTEVGTIKGEPFVQKAWVDGLKAAGLPENSPAPSVGLSPRTAKMLIFPGQKQVVQLALSALEQGDGFVIATATGSGKSYTSSAVAKEFMLENPGAKILFITRNRSLLKDLQNVSLNSFGFEINRDLPDADAPAGTYGISYQKMIRSEAAKNTKWDLVVADESGEARNWYLDENKQGKMLRDVIDGSRKALYLSATPFHSPMEYGYLDKLNLWPKGQFDRWIEQNFSHERVNDKIVARLDPAKQAKLRQQLIERGQLVSQAISYDGFTAHFGVVPVTQAMKRDLDRIHEGFARAKAEFIRRKKPTMAEKVSAFEATYTKAYLERERLPQAIELAKRARQQGWQVLLFSETSSEDLFRRAVDQGVDPSTYQMLDQEMDGQLSRIIPPFEDVYDRLQQEFGEQIGDYSGRGNTSASRDKAKADFLAGKVPIMYSTYAAGGIGVSLHDTSGDKPRISIFLGPPYSGVLLEQAMGRTWRFGVKSDTHTVFLATDSEPDVRLMQTKIGPRMRALRAAVHGERDSLAQVMATYTDEEKVRARQDALAYAEGDEQRVNPQNYQVRSKTRDVGINDWSLIQFPSAASAKNKGMKFGEDVVGGNWGTLFQKKYELYPLDSVAEAKGVEEVGAIAEGIVSGEGLPQGVSVQNLEPADRNTVTAAATASANEEVRIPVDRDKGAAGRQSMQAQLNMPGDRSKWVLEWPKGSKRGLWRYTGDPNDLAPIGPSGDEPQHPQDVRTWYLGNIFTQEIGIRAIARRAGAAEAGENVIRMNRSWQADKDRNFSQFSMMATDIMSRYKLDPHDNRVIAEMYDVVEGRKSSTNDAINRAANEMVDLMGLVNDEMATAGVKIKTPTGQLVPYSETTRDRRYMPHRIDWKAQVEDPLTGEKHTLEEVMGKKFAEQKRDRIIQAIANESGESYTAIMDYLNRFKPATPVLGHIHRARVMNFPIIRKDWSTLVTYFDQAAEGIATEKNFGSDRGKLDREIDKIPSMNGRATIRSMFDGLLEPQDWSNAASKFYNLMIGYEAASKMTLSAVKVPYHLAHAPLSLGGRVVPIMKAFIGTAIHPQRVMENATYVGTVARQLNVADLIGSGQEKGLAHEVFKRTMFNAFYKWGRAIAGESARVWMEQHAMNELKKGGTRAEHARRLIRDTLLIGDKSIDDAVARGQWSPDDLGKAQVAFANFTMFSDNALQMPGWARLEVRADTPTMQVGLHRALRLSYALQSFSLKTTSILREKLWDEVMIHHNLKPLVYAMIAYPIVGELLRATGAGTKAALQLAISGAQAGITGKGKKGEDSWDKYFAGLTDELKAHPGIGWLKRYIDDVTFAWAWDRTRRMSDPLLNLAAGKPKPSRSGFKYMAEDEVEQDIGGAWNTLVWQPLKLIAQEGDIATGEKHPEKRAEKEEKKLIQFFTDEFPVTREWPELQDWLHPKKAVRHYY